MRVRATKARISAASFHIDRLKLRQRAAATWFRRSTLGSWKQARSKRPLIVLPTVLLSTLLGMGAGMPQSADASPRTLLESLLGSEWASPPDDQEEKERARVDADRPHLPEASTTVGKGRFVLESGYTFSQRGSTQAHSYPEAILRAGVFSDWFEVRIGQNFITQDGSVSDTYVGIKLALTEQFGYLPQVAIIPQMTIATESHSEVDGRVLPGLNVDCSWEVIKNRFDLELLIATNRVREDVRGTDLEIATGLTAAVNPWRNLEIFAEWDAFYPVHGQNRQETVGGLVYFITKDIAVDIRAGIGLNRQARDFLAGTGFVIRY